MFRRIMECRQKTVIIGLPLKTGFTAIKNVNDKSADYINITEKNGLRSNIIFRVFEDFECDLWIGHSEKGISKISSLMFTAYGKEEGLISDAILAISKVNDDFIVFADKGIFRFNGQSFTFLNPSSPFSKRWYFTILPYSDSELFLGSTPGVVSLSGLSSYKIIGLDKKIIFTTLKAVLVMSGSEQIPASTLRRVRSLLSRTSVCRGLK